MESVTGYFVLAIVIGLGASYIVGIILAVKSAAEWRNEPRRPR